MASLTATNDVSFYVFTEPSTPEPSVMAYGSTAVEDVSFDDIDGDGHPDMVALTSNTLFWSRSSGNDLLADRHIIDLPNVHLASVDAGDFDGDGDVDLVTTSVYKVESYVNDGTGVFSPSPWGRSLIDVVITWDHPFVGDVDGDGRDDVVLPYQDGVKVFMGSDAGLKAPVGVTRGQYLAQFTQVGDVDGDGVLDMVISNGGVLEVYLGRLPLPDLDGDQLCDMDDPDVDGDGVAAAAGDCNDTDAGIYPGAPEIVGDGIDQDCDGLDAIPPVVETGDTGAGADADTDTDSDSDADADADADADTDNPDPDEKGDGEGCGCLTGGSLAGWWAIPVLLGLAGARRRG